MCVNQTGKGVGINGSPVNRNVAYVCNRIQMAYVVNANATNSTSKRQRIERLPNRNNQMEPGKWGQGVSARTVVMWCVNKCVQPIQPQPQYCPHVCKRKRATAQQRTTT